MYLTAMSAVSIHNLANNIREATSSLDTTDLHTVAHTNWTLDEPDKLARLFPHCNGTKQSPIPISSSSAQQNLNLRLGLTAYDKPLSGFIVNQFPTFRLVPFSFEWPRPSALLSNSLARSFNPYADSHFVLNHVQFHWLPPASQPADGHPAHAVHRVDNQSHPVEIHFVHTNTAYANLEEAFAKTDGLLIFAVMVVPSTHESYIFDRVLDELANLTEHGQQVGLNEDSTWRTLLPSDTSRFYRYQGSQIMPPCQESVQWIVFEERLRLGRKQLKRLRRFRFLAETTGRQEAGLASPLHRQVDWAAQRRPLQSVNSRPIERSFRAVPLAGPQRGAGPN